MSTGLTGISYQLIKAIEDGKCDKTTKFMSDIIKSQRLRDSILRQFEFISKKGQPGKHLILWAKDDFKAKSVHIGHLMQLCMNKKVGGRCFNYCGLFGN